MMDTYLQQAMAASGRAAANQPAPQPPAKEVVRIKCRNCGSLEAEDAAFCRKCGKAL
jgi:membrane protease subunit (stomatin/prohibitin family)